MLKLTFISKFPSTLHDTEAHIRESDNYRILTSSNTWDKKLGLELQVGDILEARGKIASIERV